MGERRIAVNENGRTVVVEGASLLRQIASGASASAASAAASASFAGQSRNAAQGFAVEANAARQGAVNAEAGALAALDAISASADLFSSTDAGLAAVGEGDYFRVAGDDRQFVSLYRKVSGAPVLVNSMLSAQGVLDALPLENLHTFPGATDSERMTAALAQAATRPMRLRLAANRGLYSGDEYARAGSYLLDQAFIHPGNFSFELSGDGIETVLYFKGENAGFEYRGTYEGSRVLQNDGRINTEFFAVRSLRAIHNSVTPLPHIFFANFKQQPSTIARQVDITDVRIEPGTTLRAADVRNTAGYNMVCLRPIHIKNAWFPRVDRFLVTFRIDYGDPAEQDVGTAGVFLDGMIVGADIGHAQITTAQAAIKYRPRRIFGLNGSVTGAFARGDTLTQGAVSGRVVEPLSSGASYGFALAVDDVVGGAFTAGAAIGSNGATINISEIQNVARPAESINIERVEMVSCNVGFDADTSYPEGSSTFLRGYGLLYNISRCHAKVYQNSLKLRGVSALKVHSNEFETFRQTVEHINIEYSASSIIAGNFFFGFAGGLKSGIKTGPSVSFMVEQSNVFSSMEKTLRLDPSTSESRFGPSSYNAVSSNHIVNSNQTNIFTTTSDSSLDGTNSLSSRRQYFELLRGDGAPYMTLRTTNATAHSANPMIQFRLAADKTAGNADTQPLLAIYSNAVDAPQNTFFITPSGRLFAEKELRTKGHVLFDLNKGIYNSPAVPEGNIGAPPGSFCLVDNGTAWLKTSGTGTTGWQQLALAS